jgi:hypothetical protein
MSTINSTDDLRLGLSILSSRVDDLERRLAKNDADTTAPYDMAAVMPEVLRITQELFPGPCELTHESDPEYPKDRYVVVNVEAAGDFKEILDRECVWHGRIRQLRADLWDKLILSVVPR